MAHLRTALLVILTTLATALLVRVMVVSGADADEVEHAHVAWLVLQGKTPYVDFHQIHLPAVWLLAAPLTALDLAPSTLILTTRSLCLAALMMSLFFAAKTFRRACSAPLLPGLLTTALMALAFAPWTEAYRFRPDPFMATLVMAAICLYAGPLPDTGPAGSGWRRDLLAGFCLGLAGCFSPKMFLMVLMTPAAAAFDTLAGAGRRWVGVIAAGLGALVAPLILAVWLATGGMLDGFRYWVIEQNAHIFNLWLDPLRLGLAAGTGLVTIVGILLARSREISLSWRPFGVVGVASFLGVCIPIVEPNHFDYNYLTAVMPTALLIALVAAAAARRPGRLDWRPTAVLAGVAALCWPPLQYAWRMNLNGTAAPLAVLDRVNRCIDAATDTCQGFAPFHTIRCHNASELYLIWDWFILDRHWTPDHVRDLYLEKWRRAVTSLETSPPAVIFGAQLWGNLRTRGLLGEDEHQRINRLIKDLYSEVRLDGIQVWMRRDRAACLEQ